MIAQKAISAPSENVPALDTGLAVSLRETAEIRPYGRNPRLNEGAVDAVAASLKEFGFRQPIVVDSEGIIIAGHTRFLAAKKLGLTKIPVHIATDLTPETDDCDNTGRLEARSNQSGEDHRARNVTVRRRRDRQR